MQLVQTLSDAFKHKFGFAQYMIFFIHVQRNVKDMLHERNITQQSSSDIMDAIFGKKLGPTYMVGLIDAADSVEFNEKMDILVREWRGMSTFYLAQPTSKDLLVGLLLTKLPLFRIRCYVQYERNVWQRVFR